MTRYFEQKEIWGQEKNEFYMDKLSLFINLIPDDVTNILDLGCGDGTNTNVLRKKWKITGLDLSIASLKYVECNKIRGAIEAVGFKDAAFDMVLCSEVLEHLSYEDYTKALAEIQRLAKRYILISVPYKEDLKRRLLKCPYCHFIFHIYGHIRSFNESALSKAFPKFQRITHFLCGQEQPHFNPLLLFIKQRILNCWFYYHEAHPLCPQCGNTDFPQSLNKLAKLINLLNSKLFFSKQKTPYWMVTLFRRS